MHHNNYVTYLNLNDKKERVYERVHGFRKGTVHQYPVGPPFCLMISGITFFR